ncbi:hypothetical protein ACKS0A_05133 [Histoplasma ohiense]
MRGWIHMEKDSLEQSKGLAHLLASSHYSFQGSSPRNSKRRGGERKKKKKKKNTHTHTHTHTHTKKPR